MTIKLLSGTWLHGSSFKTFGSGISLKPECGSLLYDPSCFVIALLYVVLFCFVLFRAKWFCSSSLHTDQV